MMKTVQIPSPVQELNLPQYKNHNVFLKREDLIHPTISGNKWRKLKYNIIHAKDKCYKGILTFGGAYSNHLHASAFACQKAGLKLRCIVRAEDADLRNPTLSDIQNWGGQISLIDRETYKLKNTPEFINELEQEYPDYFIIPEGGNNRRASKGLAEMAEEIDEHNFDYIFISVGTGSSAIGLINNLKSDHPHIHAIAAVKDLSLKSQFQSNIQDKHNWSLSFDFTRGGYAKVDTELVAYINRFYKRNNILLDPIYNAKTFMAFEQMLAENQIPFGSNVLLVHTGGIQGIRGHNARHGHKPDMLIVT